MASPGGASFLSSWFGHGTEVRLQSYATPGEAVLTQPQFTIIMKDRIWGPGAFDTSLIISPFAYGKKKG